MTDIVERLRNAGLRDGFAVILYQHVQQAADEIERLRFIFELKYARADDEEMSLTENEIRYQNAALADENARLRSLLEELLSNIWESEYGDMTVGYHEVERVRAALLAIQQEVQHITATET